MTSHNFARGSDNLGNEATIRLDGQDAQVAIGRPNTPGALQVDGPAHRIALDGEHGRLALSGDIRLLPRDRGQPRVHLRSNGTAALGGDGKPGHLLLTGGGDGAVHRFDGASGEVRIGGDGTPGALFILNEDDEVALSLNGRRHELLVGSPTDPGTIVVRSGNEDQQNAIVFNGELGSASFGIETIAGRLTIRDETGHDTFVVSGANGSVAAGRNGQHGNIFVKDDNGKNSIHLSGETGNVNLSGDLRVEGDIRLANADCAEEFPIGDQPLGAVPPGFVVAINDSGNIVPTRTAYDKRVVGVVSGAGSLSPAITLDAVPGESPRVPVAMTGKVYCRVDATDRAVELGDILVPSAIPGHAMVPHARALALGCALGKALEPLPRGRKGLVKLLVTLQ